MLNAPLSKHSDKESAVETEGSAAQIRPGGYFFLIYPFFIELTG
ncbi:MAG: hypothetical protein ACXAEU_02675 [Candidatus Hodarchaeales archaeon]